MLPSQNCDRPQRALCNLCAAACPHQACLPALARVLTCVACPLPPPPSCLQFEILTRTADGDEGGRHQLVAATVTNGNLYLLKVQIGDKRWFKGAKNDALGTWNSFTVV